jgi:general secretion pathway protein D
VNLRAQFIQNLQGRFMRRESAAIVVLLLAAVMAPAAAPDPDAPAPAPDTVKLNLPDQVELSVLIELVSDRLKMNIVCDEQLASKKVMLRTPEPVPVESLQRLLETVLAMHGLALVPGDDPGWWRVEAVKNLAAITGPPRSPDAAMPETGAVVVTQVFTIEHVKADAIEKAIKPFLTPTSSNTIALPEFGLLIVTDYARNMPRIAGMVKMVDRPGRPAAVVFVPVRHIDAKEAAEAATKLLEAKTKAESGVADPVTILHDARMNQVILIGPADAIAAAQPMVESLDSDLGAQTHVYTFQAASAERIDHLARQLIGELATRRLYKSAVDNDANLLIVTTTPEIHEQVARLRTELDRPVAQDQSPIQFYKLEHATALDVLETLRSIEGEGGLGSVRVDGPAGAGSSLKGLPGPNRPPALPGEIAPPPPGAPMPAAPAALPATAASAGHLVDGPRARIMADVNTNSIIIIADPATHRIYSKLIDRLDRRRPQVLLEVTIVTLDTSDDFALGVEISRTSEFGDDGRVLSFSSFGLSEVDEDTGSLTLTPGLGFNGAVLSSDIADIVIRALKSNARARVVSAPQILINDNMTGTLTSVNEAPFTSVNASDTVATTSFAGYAEAGTTVELTPHISQGDHLNLEYIIELNSFAGDGSLTVPPPRQTNSVASQVTIPDGHTIVVGGLKRSDDAQSIQRIPFIGDIPLLEFLVSSRSVNRNETSLFVFIRPTILRDDEFKDLKFLSRRDVARAELPPDLPVSEPLVIE